MSWGLIKSVQSKTDMRLIVPFGLPLELGSVISLRKNGNFRREGNLKSILGIELGTAKCSDIGTSLYEQGGKETSCVFRSANTASTLFPELPKASAGFDISLGSRNSWVIALTGRKVQSLEINQFRQPILLGYSSKDWNPDWALVTTLFTANMTLLAAKHRNTKLAVALSGALDFNGVVNTQLTAGASVAANSHEITQCITEGPIAVGCTGLRVRDRWFQDPQVGDLSKTKLLKVPKVDSASDVDFWESVDSLDVVPPIA